MSNYLIIQLQKHRPSIHTNNHSRMDQQKNHFPDDIQAKIVGRDTNCNYLLLKPIKILVYVDSIGCTACKLNFYDWYQKINSLGKITDLAFLFYVNTKNFKILIHQII